MTLVLRKEFQSTTVRLPVRTYERVKKVVVRSEARSFNEFVVQAIEEKVRRLTEAEIDAAFAQMAHDTDYQRASIALARGFEQSDWEAIDSAATHQQSTHQKARHDRKTRASKARSR